MRCAICALRGGISQTIRNEISDVVDSELVEMASVDTDFDLRDVRVAVNRSSLHHVVICVLKLMYYSKLNSRQRVGHL